MCEKFFIPSRMQVIESHRSENAFLRVTYKILHSEMLLIFVFNMGQFLFK